MREVINIFGMSFTVDAVRVLTAANIALVITMMVVIYLKMRRLSREAPALRRGVDIALYNIRRCQALYPKPWVIYNGKKISRGTIVRVTLENDKIYEGSLFGANDDMEVCIFTETSMIAQDLKYVVNFEALEEADAK